MTFSLVEDIENSINPRLLQRDRQVYPLAIGCKGHMGFLVTLQLVCFALNAVIFSYINIIINTPFYNLIIETLLGIDRRGRSLIRGAEPNKLFVFILFSLRITEKV